MSVQQATQWAVVELFGHQKIAGMLSEANLGGCSFVRVDVPANGDNPAFTKLYGNAAIYAISFVTEEVARAAAGFYGVRPVQSYELKQLPPADSHTDQDDQDDIFF